MPIKHLTDTYQPGRGFPRLGKLRPGDTKVTATGKTYPVDLDYFRVTFEPQYAHLEEPFRQLYGDQPKEFQPVYVIGKTANEAFPNWYEAYNSSATLLRRCDGETMTKWLDESTGQHQFAPKACLCASQRTNTEADRKKNLCSRVGRLNLLFPALMDATGVMGYLTAETGSRSNIQTVFQVLMDMERLLGTLQGVPFIFGRAPVEMNVNIDGQRKKVTKALFYLRATEAFTQQHIIRQLSGFSAPALPEPSGQQFLNTPETVIVLPTNNGNGYTPVTEIMVEANEDSEFLTYVFQLPDDVAYYTGTPAPLKNAGLDGANAWEPGCIIRLNPPLMVKTVDAGVELGIASVKPYTGDVEVERPANPFGGNQ